MIMRRIAFPNLASAMRGLSIFVFASTWDNLIWPMIVTNTAKNYVWQLGLAVFKSRSRRRTWFRWIVSRYMRGSCPKRQHPSLWFPSRN